MTTEFPQPSILYPDEGNLFEDASILRNAVGFSTKQRAFQAQSLLSPDLEQFNEEGLSYAAVNAYCAEMTAAEDVLGWMFALRDWRPGTSEASLFAQLGKVEVGRDPYTEKAAEALLDAIDETGVRKLLHIPTDVELAANGFAEDIRAAVADSVTANLGGLQRITRYRLDYDRGYVVGFNNLKHLPLGFPTKMRGKAEVLVPRWLRKHSSGRPFVVKLDGIHLQNLWIEASVENVRLMAHRAIISQAVLNCLLGLILWTRFGEPYETPPWVLYATKLRGWLDDDDVDEAVDTAIEPPIL